MEMPHLKQIKIPDLKRIAKPHLVKIEIPDQDTRPETDSDATSG